MTLHVRLLSVAHWNKTLLTGGSTMKLVAVRNLIGGFLGGAMGILASWYVSPAAIPFGVLIGVVLGWWWKDILFAFKNTWKQTRSGASTVITLSDNALGGLLTHLGEIFGMPPRLVALFRTASRTTITATVNTIVWLWYAPARFVRLLARHQMNRVHCIDFLVILGFTSAAFLFGRHVAPTIDPKEGVYAMAALFGGIALVLGCMNLARTALLDNGEVKEMSDYYRRWEIASRWTIVGYTFYSVGSYLRFAIGMISFVCILIAWVMSSALAGMVVGAVAGLAFLVLQLGYKIACRTGHLLCLGVTLITTGTAWLVYNTSFADPRVLWTVALSTGTVSGVLTEVVRHVALAFVERIPFLKKVLTSSSEETGYADTYINDVMFMWFGHSNVARLFRAICFGVPFVRPVGVPEIFR